MKLFLKDRCARFSILAPFAFTMVLLASVSFVSGLEPAACTGESCRVKCLQDNTYLSTGCGCNMSCEEHIQYIISLGVRCSSNLCYECPSSGTGTCPRVPLGWYYYACGGMKSSKYPDPVTCNTARKKHINNLKIVEEQYETVHKHGVDTTPPSCSPEEIGHDCWEKESGPGEGGGGAGGQGGSSNPEEEGKQKLLDLQKKSGEEQVKAIKEDRVKKDKGIDSARKKLIDASKSEKHERWGQSGRERTQSGFPRKGRPTEEGAASKVDSEAARLRALIMSQ